MLAMVCAATTSEAYRQVYIAQSWNLWRTRTVLITYVLARDSVTAEERTCSRIALEHTHGGR